MENLSSSADHIVPYAFAEFSQNSRRERLAEAHNGGLCAHGNIIAYSRPALFLSSGMNSINPGETDDPAPHVDTQAGQ